MFPLSIHLDTIQHANESGATPSIRKTFGWFIRLDIITSLQYFCNPERTPGQKSPPDSRKGEPSTSSYLRHLHGVVLIHPKHLNRELFTLLVLSLPNVGESARRDGVSACCEGRLDFVRVRKQPVYATNLTQRSDTSFMNIGFG